MKIPEECMLRFTYICMPATVLITLDSHVYMQNFSFFTGTASCLVYMLSQLYTKSDIATYTQHICIIDNTIKSAPLNFLQVDVA